MGWSREGFSEEVTFEQIVEWKRQNMIRGIPKVKICFKQLSTIYFQNLLRLGAESSP